MNENRFELMDVTKGFALLLVVIGHSNIGKLHFFIYIFHIPIFFIISGYFFKEYPIKMFLEKKIKSCIIPFVSFGIVLSLFKWIKLCVEENNVNFSDFIGILFKIVVLQERKTTLWFLTALFCGSIIFYLLVHFTPDDILLCVSSLAISITFILYDTIVTRPLPWNLDIGCIVQIYFFFGYLLRKYSILDRLISFKHSSFLMCIFGTLSILLAAMNKLMGMEILDMFHSQYGFFPFTIISSLLMSLAAFIVLSLIHCGWLQKLGGRTMTYFAIHQEIMIVIEEIIYHTIPQKSIWLVIISEVLLVMVTLFICFFIDRLIRNSKLRFMVASK